MLFTARTPIHITSELQSPLNMNKGTCIRNWVPFQYILLFFHIVRLSTLSLYWYNKDIILHIFFECRFVLTEETPSCLFHSNLQKSPVSHVPLCVNRRGGSPSINTILQKIKENYNSQRSVFGQPSEWRQISRFSLICILCIVILNTFQFICVLVL